MRLLPRSIGALVVSIMIWPSVAGAGKIQSPPEPVPLAPEVQVLIGPKSFGTTCTLGENSLPNRIVNLLIPPDDRYYMLLDPPDCPDCSGTNNARLMSATIKMFFVVPCTVPVAVTVLPAMGPDSCLVPNENVRLCPPVVVGLTGTAAEQIHEFTITLPDSCKFAGKAFLCFNFFTDGPSCSTPETRPRFVFGDPDAGCKLCSAWNYFVEPPHTDLCFDEPLGRPIMYASVSSCFTPTLPTSWGSVKAIYRRPR